MRWFAIIKTIHSQLHQFSIWMPSSPGLVWRLGSFAQMIWVGPILAQLGVAGHLILDVHSRWLPRTDLGLILFFLRIHTHLLKRCTPILLLFYLLLFLIFFILLSVPWLSGDLRGSKSHPVELLGLKNIRTLNTYELLPTRSCLRSILILWSI